MASGGYATNQPSGFGALQPITAGLGDTPDDLSSAAVHGEMIATRRVTVKRLMAQVVVVTVGAAIVTYSRRPTPLSATGEVSLGTITIPAATAVGKTFINDIDPVELAAGESLSFELTSAATSGQAVYNAEFDEQVEDHKNETDVTLVTV